MAEENKLSEEQQKEEEKQKLIREKMEQIVEAPSPSGKSAKDLVEEFKEESKSQDKEKKDAKEAKESIPRAADDITEQSLKLTKESEKNLLIPSEDYKNAAAIFGTKVITGYMEQYVYKRRADGLAIINVEKTDAKIHAAINFLAQFNPKDILVFCKREAGWKAADALRDTIGARVFTRRYPTGVITNPKLPDFFEPKVLLVVDPWIDKNAIFDSVRTGIPIISICDTNNVTNNVDLVIPANNKTKTSIGLVFYLLSKGYSKIRNLKFDATMEDFGVIANEEEENKIEVR